MVFTDRETCWRVYNEPAELCRSSITNALKHANRVLGMKGLSMNSWMLRGGWEEERGGYLQYVVSREYCILEDMIFQKGELGKAVQSKKCGPAQQESCGRELGRGMLRVGLMSVDVVRIGGVAGMRAHLQLTCLTALYLLSVEM